MLVLLKKSNGKTFNISKSIRNKRFEGNKTTASRSVSFDFLNTEDFKVELGDWVYLYMDNNTELYRGLVYSVDKNLKNLHTVYSYDLMIYLTKNKDSFTFEGQTASGILTQILKQFNLPIGEIVNTGYVIESLVVENRSLYSVMLTVLSETFKHTNVRYFLKASKGKIHLIKRKAHTHAYVVESGANLITATTRESLEGFATQVKIKEKFGNSFVGETEVAKNPELISKYGILQYYETALMDGNEGNLKSKANALLQQKSSLRPTLKIEVYGLEDVITGDCLLINVEKLGIKKLFYVDKDVHTWRGNVAIGYFDLLETLD